MPEVVTILRLSLYQLLHLDRVPASAVVDDAVDLTRAARKTSASGFVNASACGRRCGSSHKLPLPVASDERRMTARRHSPISASRTRIQTGSVARWLDRYGFEATERWVQFNNATPLLTAAREPPAGDARSKRWPRCADA